MDSNHSDHSAAPPRVVHPPLHQALEDNDMAALHAALRAGADVNEENRSQTALHTAVQRGLLEAVEALLAAGADANARDDMERTPLHWLGLCSPTEGTATECVRLLVRAGADLNAEDEDGEAPIHTVVRRGGGLEAMTALLDAGVSLHSRVNVDYEMNVMDCAIDSDSSACRAAVVRDLLARGAMWSRPRADHLYDLALSTSRDDAAIAQILLDHGQPGDRVDDVNPDKAPGDPYEPLPTPFCCAVRGKKGTAMVLVLLNAGADPSLGYDPNDPRNHSAIRKAAKVGAMETKQALIDWPVLRSRRTMLILARRARSGCRTAQDVDDQLGGLGSLPAEVLLMIARCLTVAPTTTKAMRQAWP